MHALSRQSQWTSQPSQGSPTIQSSQAMASPHSRHAVQRPVLALLQTSHDFAVQHLQRSALTSCLSFNSAYLDDTPHTPTDVTCEMSLPPGSMDMDMDIDHDMLGDQSVKQPCITSFDHIPTTQLSLDQSPANQQSITMSRTDSGRGTPYASETQPHGIRRQRQRSDAITSSSPVDSARYPRGSFGEHAHGYHSLTGSSVDLHFA